MKGEDRIEYALPKGQAAGIGQSQAGVRTETAGEMQGVEGCVQGNCLPGLRHAGERLSISASQLQHHRSGAEVRHTGYAAAPKPPPAGILPVP
jgi:hypothetical protein